MIGLLSSDALGRLPDLDGLGGEFMADWARIWHGKRPVMEVLATSAEWAGRLGLEDDGGSSELAGVGG